MYSLDQVKDVSIVNLLGELDQECVLALKMLIQQLLSKQMSKLVLNFASVEHVHFKSLQEILEQALKLRKFSGDLKFAQLTPYTRSIFKFMGVDQFLEDYASVDEAILSFDLGFEPKQTWH